MASRTPRSGTFESLLLRRKQENATGVLNACSTIACRGSFINDKQHSEVDAEAAQCEARMLLAGMKAAAKLQHDEGHAAALAGAACLLHLRCCGGGGRGDSARIETGVESKFGHLRPLDEWVGIPCIEVAGREASLVLERLHHSGGNTISVQVQKCMDGAESARMRSLTLDAARGAARDVAARSQRRSGAASVAAQPERAPRAPILPDGADDWMVLVPFEPEVCVEESRPSIWADQRKPFPRRKLGPGY